MLKKCSTCNMSKSLDMFYKHPKTKTGCGSQCKACSKAAQRENRKTNGYSATLKYKYGITSQDFKNMIESQQGLCYICESVLDLKSLGAKAACVDHCHISGKVRKILCRNCNTALGHAKESVIILKRMIDYIEEHHANL